MNLPKDIMEGEANCEAFDVSTSPAFGPGDRESLKEAAQIIYDAVWADPSDPSKTYQNAANALLTELRKRAGVNSMMGPFQPLSH